MNSNKEILDIINSLIKANSKLPLIVDCLKLIKESFENLEQENKNLKQDNKRLHIIINNLKN